MAIINLSAVQSTLDAIADAKPVYSELVKTFAPLLEKQAELTEKFLQDGPTPPQVDEARLLEGIHVLAGEECENLRPYLLASLKEMLPVFRELISANGWSEKEVLLDEELLVRLVEARLGGDLKQFENTSVEMDIEPTVLFSLVDAVAAPVLAAMAGRLDESFSKGRWDHGTCPFCGSLPSIGYLSQRPQDEVESVVGGGGKKHLHCSLCRHEWEFRRDTCPACGNTDQETKELLYVEEAKHERIEICRQCGTYGLCIDLREYEYVPQFDAVQIGLVHLDMIAQERKLLPVVPTTWNSIDS